MSTDWIGKTKPFVPQVRNFIGGGWIEAFGEELEKAELRDDYLLCRFSAGESGEAKRSVSNAHCAD